MICQVQYGNTDFFPQKFEISLFIRLKKKKKKKSCPLGEIQINMTCEVKWSHSVVSDSATPWTTAYQAPPSMEFSRQEYWSGLPFPSPGDLPDSGIEPGSPAVQADALSSEPPGKPMTWGMLKIKNTCFAEMLFFMLWGHQGQSLGHDWPPAVTCLA